jgi:sialate O-acetylesterase
LKCLSISICVAIYLSIIFLPNLLSGDAVPMNHAFYLSNKIFLSLLFLAGLSSVHAAAEVRLPGLFCDNMVIQREMRVPVWGWADPGGKVTVEFNGSSLSAVADSRGGWKVVFEPMTAGAGPYTMKVSGGSNTVIINNVAIGEVWLCSGQSNMAMTVEECLNAEQETAGAVYPLIRQFQVQRDKALEPLDDFSPAGDENSWLNRWVPCSPSTVKDFTGAGYFFGREVHLTQGVPVGLIHSSWGGTVAEAWTRRCRLESDPELKIILQSWPGYNGDGSWLKMQYSKYIAQADSALKAGQPDPLYYCQPTVLYNAMIAPLMPYAIRGAIWYQGESNASRAYQYRRLFPAMIENWREDWGQGDFPFFFVQLVNYGDESSCSWPYLREAQTMTLGLPNTAMAVGIDIGEADNIHPRNKQEVGRRLALAARAKVYGEKLIYSGPIYRSMKVQGSRCRIAFDHAGDGLAAGEGGPLEGFLVAGWDKKFLRAQAAVEGDKLVVWSKSVASPVAVRYAWSDNPEGCNLWNKVDGKPWLPASPFRTDDW